jgi:phage N-6-adenine-methyltransferase
VTQRSSKRNGPTMARHRSPQDHPTPREFVCAIEGRFDIISIDLAATEKNRKAARYLSPKDNSLEQDWTKLLKGKLGYLNPPFDPVAPWIHKCVTEAKKGARFVLLTRASMDTNWFWRMYPYCTVYALTPRIKFVGSKQGYPTPLMLSAFNCIPEPGSAIEKARGHEGIYRWHWKHDTQ